jgi:UDP-N-acetyl-2-amino-2-deoxyglucuronate dehydrogenase
MDAKNAVILGCGAIGPVHAAAIAESSDATLYGVCDIVPERRAALAEQYGCKSFSSVEEVLADPGVDTVHICLPHYLHAPMAIRAAEAGKHIVLEKPVALNAAEAAGIVRAVEKAGVTCCVILQNRFNPSVEKAKEWIDKGELGRMLGLRCILTWHRTPEYYRSEEWRGKWATEGGGLLINQAVHMLDMLYHLGGQVESVKGTTDTRVLQDVIEVEDTAEATLYYKDGKKGFFYATNGYSGNSPFFVEMHMEKGLLRYTDNRLLLIRDGTEEVLASDTAAELGKSYWGKGHAKLVALYYRSRQTGVKEYTDLSDAAASMGLLDAIYASSRSRFREFVHTY